MSKSNVYDFYTKNKSSLENQIGSGGTGEPPMEARVAKLEAHVEHIQNDIRDVKEDLRSVLKMIIGGFLLTWTGIIALAGLMAKGFGWL